MRHLYIVSYLGVSKYNMGTYEHGCREVILDKPWTTGTMNEVGNEIKDGSTTLENAVLTSIFYAGEID